MAFHIPLIWKKFSPGLYTIYSGPVFLPICLVSRFSASLWLLQAAGWRRCLGRWWRNRVRCNCSVFSVFTEMSPAAVSCSLLSPTSSAATQLHHTAARTRETGDYDSFSPREQNTTPPFLSCKWLKKVVGFQKETWKWALPIQQKPKNDFLDVLLLFDRHRLWKLVFAQLL